MKPFVHLSSVAAAFPDADIDTDVIFPARFLLLPDKVGLGQQLFNEKRKTGHNELPFVLDRAPFDKAAILVAGRNFGSGSSREQAVWALADFGIRCVIAPSFGEIFYANCFKNGVLPLVETGERYATLLAAAEAGIALTVDLESETVAIADGESFTLAIDPYRRRALLLGLDEIGTILADDMADIERFEAAQRLESPWLHLGADKLAWFDDLGEETAVG